MSDCSCGYNGWFAPPDPNCPEHGMRGRANSDYQRGLEDAQRAASHISPQPIGFRCTECDATRANPKASHRIDGIGGVIFANITNAFQLEVCDTCKAKARVVR